MQCEGRRELMEGGEFPDSGRRYWSAIQEEEEGEGGGEEGGGEGRRRGRRTSKGGGEGVGPGAGVAILQYLSR
jgi:hypothetical protein